MAIDVKILKDHSLIVAAMSGRIDADDAKATVRRLAGDPDFVWNYDRIVFVDDDADMSEIALSNLLVVKDEVIRAYFGGHEPDPSDLPAYRMAFVCGHAGNAAIMKLFGSVWELDPSPYVRVKLFESVVEALAWLGRDGLAEDDVRA